MSLSIFQPIFNLKLWGGGVGGVEIWRQNWRTEECTKETGWRSKKLGQCDRQGACNSEIGRRWNKTAKDNTVWQVRNVWDVITHGRKMEQKDNKGWNHMNICWLRWMCQHSKGKRRTWTRCEKKYRQ